MIRLSTATQEALEVLGASIRVGRLRRQWSLAELAERVGVSRPTIQKVERGDPTVALGTVFEAATLVGVALFESDTARRRHATAQRAELALLPASARRSDTGVNDDF